MFGQRRDDAELQHEAVGVQVRRVGVLVLQVFHSSPWRPHTHGDTTRGRGFHEATKVLESKHTMPIFDDYERAIFLVTLHFRGEMWWSAASKTLAQSQTK